MIFKWTQNHTWQKDHQIELSNLNLAFNNLVSDTDYRRPMKYFFIKTPNFWAWSDNLGI